MSIQRDNDMGTDLTILDLIILYRTYAKLRTAGNEAIIVME